MPIDASRVGPTATQLRRRVLEEQAAAAGAGVVPLHGVAPDLDMAYDMRQAVAGPPVGATQLSAVPVQQAYPGRRCQVCATSKGRLATQVRSTGTGGTDFFCDTCAPAGCSTTVRPTVAPE